MTREFNKQWRDDSRPSFRNKSPGRYGDERSPRPARPRLSRETVDRAWESGAQHSHADYRPRSNGQSPRNNWRDRQSPDSSSSRNGPGGNRSYGNRNRPYGYHQDRYQGDEGNRNNRSPRPRSFGSDRYSVDDRRFHEHDQSRGNRRGNFERDARPPRDYGRDNRDRRGPRSYERNDRSSRNDHRPDTQNPRYQSRPWARREEADQERREFTRRPSYEEQFEGDYERFDHYEAPNRPPRPMNRPFRGNRNQHDEPEQESQERQVTRLPDGRVLKGPRPVQRRNAEFWSEIAEDTEDLVAHVQAPTTEDGSTEQATEPPEDGSDAPRKAGKQAAGTRGKKANAEKPRSSGPRPSQRGFKWPAP